MAMNTEAEQIRGHQLYLKYVHLLGKATPLVLKLVLDETAEKQGKNAWALITEVEGTLKDDFEKTYLVLFDGHEVKKCLESWNISVFSDLMFVLLGHFGPNDQKCIRVIYEQNKDLEQYAVTAFLDYETFEKKWKILQKAVHGLIDNREGERKYECERLIHSYNEITSVEISKQTLERIKRSKDFSEHIEIAVHIFHGDYNEKQFKTDKDDIITERAATFIKPLEPQFVKVSDSALLFCEIDSNVTSFKWKRGENLLTESDFIKFGSSKGIVWLNILKTNLDDTGEYTCYCGNDSTTSMLHVTETNLTIDVDLHIVGDNVVEGGEMCLLCKVNTPTIQPKWFQNKVEITRSSRVSFFSENLEHKLIIRRALFDDDGEYMVAFDRVASHMNVSVRGIADLKIKHQIGEKLYKNWVRAVLGLKFLKLGLEQLADVAVEKRHEEILKKMAPNSTCTECDESNLLPTHSSKKQCYRKQNKNKCLCVISPHKRRLCPNGAFCSQMYDAIVKDHRFEDPLLKNTIIAKWSGEPWKVATCFINTTGYEGKESAKDVDCFGLLCLFWNNKMYLQNVNPNVFDIARTRRNDILHNANYELSEDELYEYIDTFAEVLQEIKGNANKYVLLPKGKLDESLEALHELKTYEIDINISEEVQILQKHAMDKMSSAFTEAVEKRDVEKQLLEEKLKNCQEELKFLRELRQEHQTFEGVESNDTTKLSTFDVQTSPDIVEKEKDNEEMAPRTIAPLELTLCLNIRVTRPAAGSAEMAVKLVYELMQSEVERHKTRTDDFSEDQKTKYGSQTTTATSVQRMFQLIFATKDVAVQNVIKDESEPKVSLVICCSSSRSVENILVTLHGNKFKECIAELRKCLELEEQGKKAFDVEASCSRRHLNDIRKQLSDNGMLKEASKDLKCEIHGSLQQTWYCEGHDTFCCTECIENEHSACSGLTDLTMGSSYAVNLIGSEIEGYVERNRATSWDVRSLCTLPSGELLIFDIVDNMLVKLDTSFNIVSYCPISGIPTDICYTTDNRAAVALLGGKIFYVNVSGNLEVEMTVLLKHPVQSLAYRDILYFHDGDKLRTCKTDGSQMNVLLHTYATERIRCIAVSDDGEYIYFTCPGRLVTISSMGKFLSTFISEEMPSPFAVCCIGDCSVIVCDTLTKSILEIDAKRGYIRKSVSTPDVPDIICFDKRQRRLLVGCSLRSYISVYELK